jgi:nucleotide-binding universal stress UspA family protein
MRAPYLRTVFLTDENRHPELRFAMNSPAASTPTIIDDILHASDFSEAGEVAFAHALKAALIARARLTLLHVAPASPAGEWGDFPGVRETLERWALIPPGSPRSAVPKLGIDVRKLVAHDDDPVRSVLRYLDGHQTDLIVLAPHRHEGRMRWFKKSVAEPIARKSGQMTLFVPEGVDGFVSLDDGSVSLTSILIRGDGDEHSWTTRLSGCAAGHPQRAGASPRNVPAPGGPGTFAGRRRHAFVNRGDERDRERDQG